MQVIKESIVEVDDLIFVLTVMESEVRRAVLTINGNVLGVAPNGFGFWTPSGETWVVSNNEWCRKR
jgi:hypothetical protein